MTTVGRETMIRTEMTTAPVTATTERSAIAIMIETAATTTEWVRGPGHLAAMVKRKNPTIRKTSGCATPAET